MSAPGTCDLLLDEHSGPCSDASHAEALAVIASRPSGAPSWSAIVHGSDGGGPLDFLDGRPIHCGSTLELQSFEYRGDDYGEYTVKLATGTKVRYERSIAGKVMLYTCIGGHSFMAPLESWMRFRWPRP